MQADEIFCRCTESMTGNGSEDGVYWQSQLVPAMPQAKHRHEEAYRSGHNEPHSKCGCPFWARGFESHRFRQSILQKPLEIHAARVRLPRCMMAGGFLVSFFHLPQGAHFTNCRQNGFQLTGKAVLTFLIDFLHAKRYA